MIAGLQDMKRGPKKKDPEKAALEAENQTLRSALCDQSVELLLLKKSVHSDYMGT
jgi:hypothetical protein